MAGIVAGEQGLKYARAGAAGISVLTEPTWFKGTLDDMRDVRKLVRPPSSSFLFLLFLLSLRLLSSPPLLLLLHALRMFWRRMGGAACAEEEGGRQVAGEANRPAILRKDFLLDEYQVCPSTIVCDA